MGTILALISVLLVCLAQISLRFTMLHLPDMTQVALFVKILVSNSKITYLFWGGILSYGLSMIFWFHALRRVPLGKAYALLSLSYVIVWLCAMVLPGLYESFSWQSLAGASCIVLGVLCIHLPWRSTAPQATRKNSDVNGNNTL